MYFNYNNGINRNAIYAVLMILVILSLLSMSASQWLSLALTLPAVIIAITFHEFAHAFAADKLGDTTPRNQGRLTLNPTAHLDPFGFILMIFAHIGWGKPVQINPNNFNTNKSRGFCETMVSLAGPLMNFFLAIVSCFAFVIIYSFAPVSFVNGAVGSWVLIFLEIIMSVNIGLGVFNLIPLPPLDGEKIFRNALPHKAQSWLIENTQTLSMIFMILWIFGWLEVITVPIINVISEGILFIVKKIVSLFLFL